MKIFAVCLVYFGFVAGAHAQIVKLSGTVFDSTGAVVVGVKVAATPETGKQPTFGTSNESGDFQIHLAPGLYALEVSGNGFLTIQYPEFLVVNSTTGMKVDFVMFGAKYHEPCGVSGSDCLPERLLIRNFKVRYSPTLKQLRDDFSDLEKQKKQ